MNKCNSKNIYIGHPSLTGKLNFSLYCIRQYIDNDSQFDCQKLQIFIKTIRSKSKIEFKVDRIDLT